MTALTRSSLYRISLLGAVAVGLGSCAETVFEVLPVASIELSSSSSTVAAGATISITAATLSADALGSAVISATAEEVTGSLSVAVVNPVPSARSLSPAAAKAGSGAFTLNVTGSNFVEGSTVRWAGLNRSTRLISATQLQADIPASDLTFAREVDVTVFNPAPGGGTSNALKFTVLNP